jgi:hypothetical protein
MRFDLFLELTSLPAQEAPFGIPSRQHYAPLALPSIAESLET